MKMMEECNSITSLHIFEFLDDSWASWVCIYFKSVAGTTPPLFLYNSTGLAAKRKPMLWGSSRGAEARASMCMMLAIKMHPELFDCELWTQSKKYLKPVGICWNPMRIIDWIPMAIMPIMPTQSPWSGHFLGKTWQRGSARVPPRLGATGATRTANPRTKQ